MNGVSCAALVLLALLGTARGADDERSLLITHLISRAGSLPPVTLALIDGDQRESTLTSATAAIATFAGARGETALPWRLVDDPDVIALARPALAEAPPEVQAAWLRLARDRRVLRADGIEWRTLFGELRRRDAAAAATVEAPAATPAAKAQEKAKTTTDEPVSAPAAVPVEQDPLAALSAAGDAPALDAASAKAWDAALFTKDGKIDRKTYVRACASLDPKDVDHRYGPSAAFLGANDEPAEIYQKIPNGIYDWLTVLPNAVDWTGHGGQIAFLPEKSDAPGIARASFNWTEHENHGGKNLWHRYYCRAGIGKEDGGQWWSAPVDPCLEQSAFREAMRDDPARTPVAMARARTSWSNHAVIAFRNGVLTASGSGNSGDRFPVTMLPKGKVPTAVALTGNNEFALVTVWDLKELKGQIAIVALKGHDPRPWMVPGDGFLAQMRVIGLVDLPETMRCPSAIAAGVDFVAHDINHQDPATFDFTNAETRAKWAATEPGGVRQGVGFPRQAYAVVASRAENRIALVDLAPLFAWLRAQYLEKSPSTGPEWPVAVPEKSLPTIAATIPVPQPTFVTCGWPTERKPTPWATRFLVGTLDGRVVAFDASTLASSEVKPAAPAAVGMAKVGRNPCGFSHGGRQLPADRMWVVCRGERALVELDVGAPTPRVLRVLRDKRLKDPIAAEFGDSRGSQLLFVADHAGRQIVNYLTAPISAWGDQVFGGLGADGMAPFECSGVTAVAGRPFAIGSSEVP